jgi:CBS domain-containing protein
MRVGEVMTRDVAVVSPYATLREAARRMDNLNVGALPVCDGRRLVGIVTDRDIVVRATAAGAAPDLTRVHDVMTDDVMWCFEDDDVEEAEEEMARVQIRRLPVVDGRKRLVGMLSLGDLATDRAPRADDTLRSISEPSEPDRSDGRYFYRRR